MLIDTHSHINDEKLKDFLPEIIENLQDKDIQRVICPSCSLDECKSALLLAKQNKRVFCAFGVHPEYAEQLNNETLEFMCSNCKNEKVVAIGEIGLDYHYGRFDKLQIEALNKQVDIAQEFKLPVIFHIRDAFDDFIPWLKQNRQRFTKGVVHCFDGGDEIIKKLLDFDLYFGFTGLATFKPRQDIRRALKEVPLDRILIETDAPYLAPDGMRGTINRPENCVHIAKRVASELGIEYETLCDLTTQNAYRLFDKMRIFDEKSR